MNKYINIAAVSIIIAMLIASTVNTQSVSASFDKDLKATSLRMEWKETLNYPTPASLVIKDPEVIKILYNAIMSLPRDDREGRINCPADTGEILHMYFLNMDAVVKKFDIKTSGCGNVYINSIQHYRTDSFDKIIENTLGRDVHGKLIQKTSPSPQMLSTPK